MAKLKACKSCGMPMKKDADHGAKKPRNPYCIYCTTVEGKLKSKSQVEERLIGVWMKHKKANRKEAKKTVKHYMSKMLAWKKGK